MLKTLHGFSRSLFPFIEIIFLSFVLGIALESAASAITCFLFLIVTVYFWSVAVRSIGWGIAVFILLFHIPSNSLTFQITVNLLVGVIVGGIRYLVIKIKK